MEKNSLKLSCVGDIFPANLGYNAGFGVASKFLEHKGNIWDEQLNEILGKSDIVFANLESPLIKNNKYCDINNFAGHSSFTDFLLKHSIKIVSIANNHILEQGTEGFYSTCNILKQSGIKYVGRYENNHSNIEVIDINDIKIGFCAFNGIHDIKNPNLYAELSLNNLFNTIYEINNLDLDYRVVSLHWGNEYCHYPSKEQIDLAHKVIDSNIDIIVGHHPHVVQPVEEYKNGVIFYSLGNFIFDMLWSEKVRHGLIVKFNFTKEKFKYDCYSTILSNDYIAERYPNGDKIIRKINGKHNQLISINKMQTNSYELKANISRLIQRILMKKEILKNWKRMSKNSKKDFISKFRRNII